MTRTITARIASQVDRTFTTAYRRFPVAAGTNLRQLTLLPRLQDEQQPVAPLLVANGVRPAQWSVPLTLSISKPRGSSIDTRRNAERIARLTLPMVTLEKTEGHAP
jgi:hypothetical protein